ncbi:hypothetical protein B0H21DRAFT_766229 [Amylocystis lapponica]|nr:hypothetical protein B0H21DRAFT_766229 [Amylocystis lapponica]
MDDPPLLPTRLEQGPIPIRAPRPTLPPESFQAVIQSDWQGDWDLMRAMSDHIHTKEEEVHALGQDLLDAILNPEWVDSPVCYVPKNESRATPISSQLQSSEPGTPLSLPTSHVCRTSTPSTSSWQDCLGSPADSAAESLAIRIDADATDAAVCINIESCVLEARRMGWQHQWRAFIRQQVQCRLETQDNRLRDKNRPARSVTPDRLGAWPLIIEA